jgi:glycosyltransferase involved in cell wall biosynthesis
MGCRSRRVTVKVVANHPSRTAVLAIAWMRHRRMVGLCERLGLEFTAVTTRRTGFVRWLELGLRTIAVLVRTRPRAVLAQNPSIVLVLVALALRPVLRYRVIVDAHNEAIEPVVHAGAIVRRVARRLLRAADFTIVTNSTLAAAVRRAGGRPIELVDPVPGVPSGTGTYADSRRIVVIATFAPDEPLDEIIVAAASPDCSDLEFVITGRPPPVWAERDLPPNVRLSGFLAENAYWSTLAGAAVIVDVTTMPACLVCGAYEALAVGRPMVLAGDPVNVEIFGPSAVYVEASSTSIITGICDAFRRGGAACLVSALGMDQLGTPALRTTSDSPT